MYIAPNSTIKIYRAVPLDRTYEHTVYFEDKDAQLAAFNTYLKHTLSAQSFVRAEPGKIRVQLAIGELYDCNYMIYRNDSFSSKWFYAFITRVEYVNNATTEITFELDVMQTWITDYQLLQCFVEREHTVTDRPGENTVPERLELGPYVINSEVTDTWLLSQSIVIATTAYGDIKPKTGGIYAGVYNGLKFTTYEATAEGASHASNFIQNLAEEGHAGAIVAVFMCPSALVVSPNAGAPNTHTVTTVAPATIDGYSPKNNKLLTWPYCGLYVTNYSGGSANYTYEQFADRTSISLSMRGDYTANPTVLLAPLRYKNSGARPNFDEMLTLSGWPMCGYQTDTYKNWLAQNANQLTLSAISTTIAATSAAGSAIGGLATGNAIAGAAGGASLVNSFMSVLNLVSEVERQKMQPNQASGVTPSGILSASDLLNFGIMHKCITAQFAERIDSFFNVYGYAVNTIKVPNRTARPIWNYVKLGTVNIYGRIPADAAEEIHRIYQSGITFWKDIFNVGDYSRDNRPLITVAEGE